MPAKLTKEIINQRLSDRGIELIGDYTGSKTKATFRCKLGHEWSAVADSVVRKTKCPFCASNARQTKESINKKIAHRDIKLIGDYFNNKTKTTFKCQKGHEWDAAPASVVLSGTGCPVCSRSGSFRITIDEMHELAEAHHGKCLSKKYIRSYVKLRWRCKEGHEFEASPDNIRQGRWCPICGRKTASKKRMLSVEALEQAASQQGGKCLSTEYRGSQKKYLWQCAEGHQWEATHNNVMRGFWCPYCAGKYQTIEDLKQIAIDRGGKCLSDEYKGMRRKYLWECVVGHQWEAVADSIKCGRWCPICGGSIGERIVRDYLEQMTGEKFPALWPEWLINNDGNRLELDGYCEKLQIAFEHQGRQHTEQIKFFHPEKELFQKQLSRDWVKKALCKKHGIKLIEVSQLFYSISLEELYDFLAKALKTSGVMPIRQKDQISLDLRKIYSPDFLTKLHKIIRQKNGKLLSGNRLHGDSKISLRCDKGHEWDTTIPIILSGSWCPKCGYTKSWLTLDDCKAVAAERGGQCLSDAYINARTKMRWRCSKGHEWETTFGSIRSGQWCPTCAKDKMSSKMRKYSIKDMQNHAQKLGGECLSTKFINSHSKLKWRCDKRHEWEAAWTNVRSGQWCPTCAISKAAAKKRKYSIEDMKKHAKKLGGECLSTEYLNFHAKLKWRCSEGHTWENNWANIKKGGWCAKCSQKNRHKK